VSGRTEPPTPRRLREARRRGEVAISRDLTGAAALAAGLGALAATGPAAARTLSAFLRSAIAEAVGPGSSPAAAALLRASTVFASAALPACAAAGAGALVAGLVQSRGLFTLEAARLRPERLDLARGLARLGSGERLAGVALAAGKAAAALTLAAGLVRRALPEMLAGYHHLDAAALLRGSASLALRVTLPLLGLLIALGCLDLALARRRLRRGLGMTRAEVERERREEQGDPRLVAERRRLARALGGGPVRQATCLVVNPTHVAVALRHEAGRDEPPWVLAKGMGAAAARLRAEARRAGVPVVRDVALARALFRLAEAGDAIPEELYDAAAAVLVHVRGKGSLEDA